ncbi:MAG: hypothetical protein KIB03_14740 [Citrobacter freundii]|nr:hypothetical protein [Citrobacter freundii]
MIATSFDDLIWDDHLPQQKRSPSGSKSAKIENQDGSTMFVAEIVTIEIEEEIVTTPESPHLKVPLTFKSAMWMGIGFLAVALGGAWAMYTHLDNKLETYRSGTESRIEASRTSLDSKIESSKVALDSKIDNLRSSTDAHFEAARVENKTDNAALSNQLQAITNSLSEINGKLSKDK